MNILKIPHIVSVKDAGNHVLILHSFWQGTRPSFMKISEAVQLKINSSTPGNLQILTTVLPLLWQLCAFTC